MINYIFYSLNDLSQFYRHTDVTKNVAQLHK